MAPIRSIAKAVSLLALSTRKCVNEAIGRTAPAIVYKRSEVQWLHSSIPTLWWVEVKVLGAKGRSRSPLCGVSPGVRSGGVKNTTTPYGRRKVDKRTRHRILGAYYVL